MRNLQYPPFIHWEVTPECNHNCVHCYNYWRKDFTEFEKLEGNFDESHYKKIAQKLVEQKAHTIVITGGEPLLVFKKIKSSIKFLRENDINISINTNSTLLNSEIIDFIKSYDLSLFISFPCSNEKICDFITNKPGSWKRIIDSLDTVFEYNLRFSLNVVVSKANINYLQTTLDFLKQRYEIKKIYITRVGKPVNSDATFDKYLLSREDLCYVQDFCVKTKSNYGIDVDTGCPYTLCSINSQAAFELFGYKKFCTAGKTSYSIDVCGNVKACPRDSKQYGNILKEDFNLIWDRMNEWRDGSLLPKECEKCNMKGACKGGCRVDAFPFTGKLNSLDTTARIEKVPVSYYTKKEEVPKYTNADTFSVNSVRYVDEEFGCRISYKQAYIYVTKELEEFLRTHVNFIRDDIISDFSVDGATADSILRRLLKNGIITLTRR